MKPLPICSKCNQMKPKYGHVCPPAWVMRLKLVQRQALEIAARRYDPAPARKWWQGNNPPPIEGLPAPTPAGGQFIVSVTPAPAPTVSPAPTVRLLPTLLLGGVSAQREPEPLTTAIRKVRASKFKWIDRCPPGNCGAAAIATDLHHLPWSYTAVLRDREGAVLDSLAYFRETGLAALDSLVSSPPKLTDPFYLFSLVSHVPLCEFNPLRPTGLHVHLCVGNLTWDEFNALLYARPGYVASKGKQSMKGREWQSLHYSLAQDPATGDPLLDNYEPAKRRLSFRHIVDQGRGQGHLFPARLLTGSRRPGSIHQPDPRHPESLPLSSAVGHQTGADYDEAAHCRTLDSLVPFVLGASAPAPCTVAALPTSTTENIIKTLVGKYFHTFQTDGSFKWHGIRSEMAVNAEGREMAEDRRENR